MTSKKLTQTDRHTHILTHKKNDFKKPDVRPNAGLKRKLIA